MFNYQLYKSKKEFSKVRAEFFEDSATVIRQGVAFHEVLQMKSKMTKSLLKEVFKEISRRFTSGKKLSESFKGFLPEAELQALQGWDSSKSDKEMAEGFQVISKLGKAFIDIEKQLNESMGKAIFAIVLVMFIYYQLHSSIYPSITQNFPVEKWGLFSRAFYYLLNILFANTKILFVSIVLIIAGYIWSLKNWQSPIRRRLDQTILYGWFKSYRSLTVLLTLAMNMKSYNSINVAIRQAIKMTNRWEHWYLEKMIDRNNKGMKGGEVFDVGFFDTKIIERIIMLSSTGSAEKALYSIAFESQKELLDSFKAKIDSYGIRIKNIALVAGAIPIILFFITVGDYIFSIVGGR